MKARNLLKEYWLEYARARGYFELGLFRLKKCECCGREMFVLCKIYDGVMYAHKEETKLCKKCRKIDAEEMKLSFKLSVALS